MYAKPKLQGSLPEYDLADIQYSLRKKWKMPKYIFVVQYNECKKGNNINAKTTNPLLDQFNHNFYFIWQHIQPNV